MHYINDARYVILLATASVGLMAALVGLWRTFENGKQGKRNASAIEHLGASDDEIRGHVEVMQAAIDGMKATLAARSTAPPGGRRATDPPIRPGPPRVT